MRRALARWRHLVARDVLRRERIAVLVLGVDDEAGHAADDHEQRQSREVEQEGPETGSGEEG